MAQDDVMVPLNPDQFDMNNETQAAEFLDELLDDSILQYNAQTFSRYFWYGILVVICLFAARNIFWKISNSLRRKSSSEISSNSSNRRGLLNSLLYTVVRLGRALALQQATPSRARFWLRIPPLGSIILITTYLGFIIALEFVKNDVAGAQYWTSLGIRAGWLATAQLPLLILLAGKVNLIGLVIGSSYERLNILHRWVARSMLMMAIMHFAFLDHSWSIFDVRSLEWSTDSCVPTGFATFGLLVWMNVSTVLPLRSWSYEFFVLQHLFTFFGFIIAIMYHLPDTALETRTYVWTSIGVYFFDRLVRTGRSLWNDAAPTQATLTSMGDVTKISVRNTRLRKWGPGSFVLLSMADLNSLQSHPATIVSTPSSHDGHLIFLLKTWNGFTKSVAFMSEPKKGKDGIEAVEIYRTYIDGPYGGTQRDFAMFDTALLIAGSTGITFVMSILLDLASRIGRERLPLRRLEVVWAVKHRHQLVWLADEFQSVLGKLKNAGVEVRFAVHVTQASQSGQSSLESKINTSIEVSNLELPCASVSMGRPQTEFIIGELLSQSQSEMGVAVCGPLSMSCDVRRAVAARCLTGATGIYLHVEGFTW